MPQTVAQKRAWYVLRVRRGQCLRCLIFHRSGRTLCPSCRLAKKLQAVKRLGRVA